MRSYRDARILSVGSSRRVNSELRTLMPEISIVPATPSGLPVAYGLSEVLRPRQIYWTEKDDAAKPMRFCQGLAPTTGEKVILLDDILRSGQLLAEAKGLLEAGGAQVLALAVLVHAPTPATVDFGALPIYRLATLEPRAYVDRLSCDLCKRGIPVERIGRDPKWTEATELFMTTA
jgi:orotate phosphoribosyltransferase